MYYDSFIWFIYSSLKIKCCAWLLFFTMVQTTQSYFKLSLICQLCQQTTAVPVAVKNECLTWMASRFLTDLWCMVTENKSAVFCSTPQVPAAKSSPPLHFFVSMQGIKPRTCLLSTQRYRFTTYYFLTFLDNYYYWMNKLVWFRLAAIFLDSWHKVSLLRKMLFILNDNILWNNLLLVLLALALVIQSSFLLGSIWGHQTIQKIFLKALGMHLC